MRGGGGRGGVGLYFLLKLEVGRVILLRLGSRSVFLLRKNTPFCVVRN